MSKSPFLTELAGLNFELATSKEDLVHYGKDWTVQFDPDPLVVVFPRSAAEVSRLLKLCLKHGISVVPSGGRTGLAGGAVAAKKEVVLSLSKMNALGEVDVGTRTVRAQAGVVTQAVHERALEHGLVWPIDLAAKGSSQVGGNLATNAGGLRVIRYGHVRHWVQSLEVVLMSGATLELNGALEKNNTGYDLRQLMIGSEGTLGVITAATLKLCPQVKSLRTLFFGLDGLPKVLELFEATQKAGFEIFAFECQTQACFDLVRSARGLEPPFAGGHAFYVLLEVKADGENALLDWLKTLFDEKIVGAGTLAESSEAACKLWTFREGITESLNARGLVYKNDLALPLRVLEGFCAELFRDFKSWYGEAELFVFGHIGDGNLHINVLKGPHVAKDDFYRLCLARNDLLFSLVKKYGGSIAAEHGIGLLKKDYLHYSRSPEEIEIFRGIKKVFDPQNLLNPRKIFDDPA